MRRHCSLRSSGVSAECSSATFCRRPHPAAHHLRRQPNLRNQQDRRQPPVQRPLHRRQINRRLARSRHPMQQKWMESPQRRCQRGQRLHLRLIQPQAAPAGSALRPSERRPAAHRSAPARAAPAFAAWTKANPSAAARPAAVPHPQAASSARIACCFTVSAGSRASGISTANRSIRRASRSAAAVSRAIHFLRTRAASTGSVAAVAVRSVETFTGSPDASRQHPPLQVLLLGRKFAFAFRPASYDCGKSLLCIRARLQSCRKSI
jgi:hypothetical protein